MRKSIQALAVFCLAAGMLLPTWAGEAGKAEEGAFFIRQGEAFSLNISTLLQVRADYNDDEITFSGPLFDGVPDVDYDSQSDFIVRRARLRFFGQAGAEWLSYMLDVDLASRSMPAGDMLSMPGYSTELSPELQDAWLRFRLGENHSVTVGQQKDPFDYFYQEYSRDQMFVERPYISDEPFAPRRQVGVRYSGHTTSNKFGWDAMLSNGNGTGSLGNDNDKFAVSGRIYFQTPGFFGSGMTALPGTYQGLRYGLGVAAHNNKVGTTMVCQGGLAQTCGYDTDTLSGFEVFGGLAGTRARINFSWQSWSQDDAGYNAAGALDQLQLDSYTVEAGAWVGSRSELALRYESSTTDPLDTLYSGELQSEFETTGVTAGFNYYFKGNHNLKLQVNVGQFKLTADDALEIIYGGAKALADGDFIRGRTEAKSNFIRIGIQHAF
ncbi:MAG TPA: hypothetical protein ENK10_00400 [Acidobacteria bacterium]|nr:hypothetical protein [Acidobacteriota bacterium]